MTQKLFLITLFCCIGSSPLFSQNECLETYDREGIYLRTDFWAGTRYIKNGQPRNLGIFYKHLNPEFEKTPEAMPLFLKAKRNAKIATVVGIVTGVTAILGGVMACRSVNQDGFITNQPRYDQGIILLSGSAILSLAVNMPLQIKSRRQLDDAIWLRNRAFLGN